MRTLTIALGKYPHAHDLLSGAIPVPGYRLQAIEVDPIIGAYRRMIRELAFDICELAPTSYLMAREAGLPLTAIPVFLNRRFHHADIQCASESGIRVPDDLEYRRVGVRAYSVTTAVWVRGLLSSEYGVDCEAITWVVDDDDHIPGRSPDNVEVVDSGHSLAQLLVEGKIDAALTGNAGTGRKGAPQGGWTDSRVLAPDASGAPYPLFPNAEVLARDWYLRTRIYPLHSIVVIKQALVDENPDLPSTLFAAFVDSKQRQVAEDPAWTAIPHLGPQALQIGGDPLPYGLNANAVSDEALVRFTGDQGLIDTTPEPKDLFAPGDYPDG